MKRLHVRPAATWDVEETSLYYFVKQGERLSRRFEEAVGKTFERILESPLAGAPEEFLSPKLSGLRMWPVGGFEKHLVFYRPTDDGIEVVRVLHGARDIEAIFEAGE